jgi:histone acetyltransferase SAS3
LCSATGDIVELEAHSLTLGMPLTMATEPSQHLQEDDDSLISDEDAEGEEDDMMYDAVDTNTANLDLAAIETEGDVPVDDYDEDAEGDDDNDDEEVAAPRNKRVTVGGLDSEEDAVTADENSEDISSDDDEDAPKEVSDAESSEAEEEWDDAASSHAEQEEIAVDPNRCMLVLFGLPLSCCTS